MMTDHMKLPSLFPLHAVVAPLALLLAGCGTLQKLPKVSLPKIPDVKVPFVGDDSTAPSRDPEVPYSLTQVLGYGHTLEVSAYAGQISPSKMFSGRVMIDEDGVADFGKYGPVKLGGLRIHEAVAPIESAIRRKRGQALITVQIVSVESAPLLQVKGAVKRPGILTYFDGATPATILPAAGGRQGDPSATAVYVTREGVRSFHVNYLTKDIPLQPGDVVTFSESL